MANRADLHDGTDSLENTQLKFDLDTPSENTEEPASAEWYNALLRTRFKIDLNDGIFRYISEFAKSRKRYKKTRWIGWKDTDVVWHDKTDVHRPPIQKTHQYERTRLAGAILKVAPDIFENSAVLRKEFEYKLNLLSLLDISDISRKLSMMTRSRKRDYIQDVMRGLRNREQDNNEKYRLEMGVTDAPEGTPDGFKPIFEEQGLRYVKHNLSVTDHSTAKPVRAKGGKSTWVGTVLETAPFDPTIGRDEFDSNFIDKAWFYKDENGNWKLFDGFKTVDGTVEPDSTRSDLLMQHGLINRYKMLSDKVGSIPASRIGDEQAIDLNLGMDKFNDSGAYAPFPHTPSYEPKRAQDWFSSKSGEWDDSEGGMLGLTQLSDEAKLVLFNDLDNIDLDDIPEQIDFMLRNHYLPVNHPSGLSNPEVRTLIDARNERGIPQPDEVRYPYTGFMRVVDKKGNVVPYSSLTAPEGADFRGHWSNLYDRILGWLHHTEEGREIWETQLEVELENSEAQKGRDKIFAEKDFEELGMPIKGKIFIGEGPLQGRTIRSVSDELVKEANQLDELELHFTEDSERPDDLLTDKLEKHQVNWLIDLGEGEGRGYNAEEVHGRGIWDVGLDEERYKGADAKGDNAPPGIEAKRDILFGDTGLDHYRRTAENTTEEYFIGQPIVKTDIDSPYTIFERAANSHTNMAIIRGEKYHIDEMYPRRERGRFVVDGVEDSEDMAQQVRYTFRDTLDGVPLENVPNAMAENTEFFAGSLSDYFGYTMMDKMVQDGILPEEYGTPGTVRRTGDFIPKPPDFDTEESHERITALNTIVRGYLHLRGLDNESGLYRYEELESDHDAGRIKFPIFDDDGIEHSHILDVVYAKLGEGQSLVNDEGVIMSNFKYTPSWSLKRTPAASNSVVENSAKVIEANGGDVNDPKVIEASQDAHDEVRSIQERIASVLRIAKEKNLPPDKSYIAELEAKLGEAKKAALIYVEATAMAWSENDEAFNDYTETIRNRRYSEILQNAPLNVRATAFRHRINKLNQMLDTASTQGDLHNVARDWARTGLIEYKDLLPVDKDGASKLQRLRRRLENTNGVDWEAIDKEYTDIQHTNSSLENLILATKEKIDVLRATGLTTQKGEKEKDFPPKEWEAKQEADARLSGFRTVLRGYEKQLKQLPSYGSAEHIKSLREHPATAGIYNALDNTSVDSINPSLYEGMKEAPNPVADILRTGVNAWTESRLKGDFVLTNFFQALAATIGEATGIGGDKLRGLDVTKPLDEHRREYGGSWADWLRPVPIFWGAKIKDVRSKAAGSQGERYIPDPTMESEVYVGKEPTGVTYQDALEATDATLTTETPPYKAPAQRFGPEAETEEKT